MPKMKTKRAAAKRFRVTGGGAVKRGSAYRRHKLSAKSAKRKRHLAKGGTVDRTEEQNVRELLPYA